MIKLKDCPFCGSADIKTEKTATDGSVWCYECLAKITMADTQFGLLSGQGRAVYAWNRRAPLPTLVEADGEG